MRLEISRRLFDVDDYHRMVEAGILTEDDRVELIDGEIVAMTPIGPRHNAAVDRATRALVQAVGDRAIVRVRGSVRLDRFREPQPDIVLLRPQPDFYASRMPGPPDILLIIEVSDSSRDYDRDLKSRVYSESGVPEYWIVDLDARTVTCGQEPGGGAFRHVGTYPAGQSLAPRALPDCAIPVNALLAE